MMIFLILYERVAEACGRDLGIVLQRSSVVDGSSFIDGFDGADRTTRTIDPVHQTRICADDQSTGVYTTESHARIGPV